MDGKKRCPSPFDLRSTNFSTGQMIFTTPPHALSRPRLQHGECQLNALRLYVYLQTCRQLSPLEWSDRLLSKTPLSIHRLAKSITQLTLCQVTTSEVDDATKLLEKVRQKLQGIQNIPSQRVTLRQLYANSVRLAVSWIAVPYLPVTK